MKPELKSIFMFLDYLKKEIIKKKALKELGQLKDKKGFLKAGLPRFNRLFGRDSLISAWQLLDKKPGICQATLEVLSQLQGKVFNKEREEEPGKIIHETNLGKHSHLKNHFPFPYFGSVDSTPLFLILFSFYYRKTKNIKFLNRHWKNILMALHWMEECGDRDKDLFLEYERKNPKGLFHQAWKDSSENTLRIKPPVAMVEVQGYQYLALKEISWLAEIKQDQDLAEKLEQKTEKLKNKFNKEFWMENEKYFALALDKQKKHRKAITSNPGHLLFTGILNKDKADFIVTRLFKKELFTPFGIRTHSSLEPDFNARSYHLGAVWPHDNWIIAQGLKKMGYQEEYKRIKNAIMLAYNEIGFLPEFYGVINGKVTLEMRNKPCYPQAWSSAALFNFLSD